MVLIQNMLSSTIYSASVDIAQLSCNQSRAMLQRGLAFKASDSHPQPNVWHVWHSTLETLEKFATQSAIPSLCTALNRISNHSSARSSRQYAICKCVCIQIAMSCCDDVSDVVNATTCVNRHPLHTLSYANSRCNANTVYPKNVRVTKGALRVMNEDAVTTHHDDGLFANFADCSVYRRGCDFFFSHVSALGAHIECVGFVDGEVFD